MLEVARGAEERGLRCACPLDEGASVSIDTDG